MLDLPILKALGVSHIDQPFSGLDDFVRFHSTFSGSSEESTPADYVQFCYIKSQTFQTSNSAFSPASEPREQSVVTGISDYFWHQYSVIPSWAPDRFAAELYG